MPNADCPIPRPRPADVRAVRLAPLVNRVMAEGHVTASELARQLAECTGRAYTRRQMRDVLGRLRRLQLLAVLPRGPFAVTAYTRRTLRRDSGANRAALRAHADQSARELRPTIVALAEAGFSKPAAIAAELNRRAIAPRRAEHWTESSVKHLLARLRDLRERGG